MHGALLTTVPAGVYAFGGLVDWPLVFWMVLGSMPGALLGGVLIGVSEALAGLFIDPSAKSMISFALLIVVLLFRPQGLLAGEA